MSVRDIAQHINKFATLRTSDGWNVTVQIVDCKSVFGRTIATVTDGSTTANVNMDRLKFAESK